MSETWARIAPNAMIELEDDGGIPIGEALAGGAWNGGALAVFNPQPNGSNI